MLRPLIRSMLPDHLSLKESLLQALFWLLEPPAPPLPDLQHQSMMDRTELLPLAQSSRDLSAALLAAPRTSTHQTATDKGHSPMLPELTEVLRILHSRSRTLQSFLCHLLVSSRSPALPHLLARWLPPPPPQKLHSTASTSTSLLRCLMSLESELARLSD